MSKRLGPELPERLYRFLNASNLDRNLFKVILLVTIDEGGWPYVSMLSLLEVVAVDRANIRLAPWSASTTTANLRRTLKATLIVVDSEMAYYIQGTATELSAELARGGETFPGMAKINLKVESVLEDQALDYEGSARVTTGIRFENPQMDDAYIARGRRILEALRQG